MYNFPKLIALCCLLAILSLLACRSEDTLTQMCCPEITPLSCNMELSDFSELVANFDSTFDLACPVEVEEVYLEKYSYSNPAYNPNNPNEIAFIRSNNETTERCVDDLCTFNFCTGELSVLVEEVCDVKIDWSAQDWIAFSKRASVHKIKKDGNDLTLVHYDGAYSPLNLFWSITGDSIYIWEVSGSSGSFCLFDQNGNQLTCFGDLSFANNQELSDNNLISSSGHSFFNYGLRYYDVLNKTTHQVEILDVSASRDSIIFDTDWIDNNESILWVTDQNIFKTNIFTQERTIVSKGADNRRYRNADPSPGGKHILIEREDLVQINPCEISVTRSIYVLDADGKNPRRVLFPE